MSNKKLQDLVVYLNDNGVFPYVESGKLEIKCDDKVTSPRILDALADNVFDLIAFLQEQGVTKPLDIRGRLVSPFSIGEQSTLHELFEAQVSRIPNNIALRFNGGHLTYDGLNRRANQIAHCLRKNGVGKGQLVGLCFERGTDSIAAVLGVLKLGAAYVPLNPEYSSGRINTILSDAGVAVLVTDHQFIFAVKEAPKLVDLTSAEISKTLAQEDNRNLAGANATADSLAYVLYTSGSTGKPKGVMIKHFQVALALKNQEVFGFDEKDSMAGGGSFAFDISLFEQIFPLLCGGVAVLLSKEELLDVTSLIKVTESVSFFSAVTSLMKVWVSELQKCQNGGMNIGQLYPKLRCILVGGEPVPRWLFQDLQDLFPYVRIVELYGPTENTILSTYHVKTELLQQVEYCIGVPYPHVTTYVVDDNLKEVPTGTVGELVLAGKCVASGYLNRPEETNNSFIANHLDKNASSVLYRTGDMVRRLKNGTFEFIGRHNMQIKLRGYRIEPSEIESAILKVSDVAGAIVLAQEDEGQRNKHLVAYVVCRQVTESEQAHFSRSKVKHKIRLRLTESLPSFMIPSKIVVLDEFPLTVNGKIDRAALPQADAEDVIRRKFVAPENQLQKYLCSLWEQVLKVEKVGVDDSFFELGGHSLLIIEIVSELRRLLQEKMLHFVILYDYPTVRRLAEYLSKNFSSQLKEANVSTEGFESAKNQVTVKTTVTAYREFKSLIPRLSSYKSDTPKNPKAVFILSPPRSGSTLLRVMLEGHSKLFAPPELELLGFENLQHRKKAFQGRNEYWLEGLLRTIMELKQCDLEAARNYLMKFEDDRFHTKDFYSYIQTLCSDKTLIDKTPSYSLDIETLRRAESYFEDALFIHLVRHPNAVINSFQENRMEELFFRFEHGFKSRNLAEMIWTHSHQNILNFLQDIPADRQHCIYFEELTSKPMAVMRELCSKFAWEFEDALVKPYSNTQQKMIDGVHHDSKMLGDLKFSTHKGISEKAALNWQRNYDPGLFFEECAEIASKFGY